MHKTGTPFNRVHDSLYRTYMRLRAEKLERDINNGLVRPNEREATMVQLAHLRKEAQGAPEVVTLSAFRPEDDELDASNVLPFRRRG